MKDVKTKADEDYANRLEHPDASTRRKRRSSSDEDHARGALTHELVHHAAPTIQERSRSHRGTIPEARTWAGVEIGPFRPIHPEAMVHPTLLDEPINDSLFG